MTTESNEATETHLWEPGHPYYCAEGNYYQTGQHNLCESWQQFMDEIGGADPDLNLVYRWDWVMPDPENDEDESAGMTLLTFWMMQRKARCMSYECKVTPEDEPAVRAWLEERAKTIVALWAPIKLA